MHAVPRRGFEPCLGDTAVAAGSLKRSKGEDEQWKRPMRFRASWAGRSRSQVGQLDMQR